MKENPSANDVIKWIDYMSRIGKNPLNDKPLPKNNLKLIKYLLKRGARKTNLGQLIKPF